MKVAINRCFGGFSISEKAYERLIELGVPVRAHIPQKQDKKTRLYLHEPANDGECIFDRDISESTKLDAMMRSFSGRYWDCSITNNRTHPLLIQAIEELGLGANGKCSDLRVVEIPDGIEWEISEYDGLETVEEKHRSWTGEEGE